jgi:hypothetical protein
MLKSYMLSTVNELQPIAILLPTSLSETSVLGESISKRRYSSPATIFTERRTEFMPGEVCSAFRDCSLSQRPFKREKMSPSYPEHIYSRPDSSLPIEIMQTSLLSLKTREGRSMYYAICVDFECGAKTVSN